VEPRLRNPELDYIALMIGRYMNDEELVGCGSGLMLRYYPGLPWRD
jgi:hypothetical protein